MNEINRLEEYLKERSAARRKKRNKIIAISLGILLLGGGTFFLLTREGNEKEQRVNLPPKDITVVENETPVSLQIKGAFKVGEPLHFLIQNPTGKRHRINLGEKVINIKNNYKYTYQKTGSYQIVFTPHGTAEPISQTIHIQAEGESESVVNAFYKKVNKLEKEEKNHAFVSMKVDKPPIFKGGENALMAFIQTHIGDVSGAEGRVLVGFDVLENGQVREPYIIEGINKEIDSEVLNAFKGMPHWIPAKKNGKAVRTSYRMPFYFTK